MGKKTNEYEFVDLEGVDKTFFKITEKFTNKTILNQDEIDEYFNELTRALLEFFDKFDYTIPMYNRSIRVALDTGIGLLKKCDDYRISNGYKALNEMPIKQIKLFKDRL